MAQGQIARQLLSVRAALCTVSRNIRPPSHFAKTLPLQRQTLQPLAASLHTTVRCNNSNIINIQDEEDFTKRVLESSTPVIVDFHAVWCGPCKMLGPRLESMVSEHDGKVLLAKVDIDDNSDLAMEHGVEAVPTVLGVKNGKVVDKFIGMKDDDSLGSFIDGLVR